VQYDRTDRDNRCMHNDDDAPTQREAPEPSLAERIVNAPNSRVVRKLIKETGLHSGHPTVDEHGQGRGRAA
jgi:hypothetical protein